MFRYAAFGLRIESEIFFPELPDDKENGDFDISITVSPVSGNGIDNPSIKALFFQSNTELSWFNVPGLARFLVMNGQQIFIDPNPGVAEERLRFFILNCCLNYLFTQRGLFVLQGHVIRVGEGAILLTGYPNRLYASDAVMIEPINTIFLNRGYSILSNDVCVLNKQLFVSPSYPRLPINKSHVSYLNKELHRIEHQHVDKIFVSIEDNFCRESLPLKGIYGVGLRIDASKPIVVLDSLAGVKRFIYAAQCYKGMQYDENFLKKIIDIPFKPIDSDFNIKTIADYTRCIGTPSILYDNLNRLADSIEEDMASECLEEIS